MRKIWIDGYEANVEQRLGSGQVAFELLRNIEALDRENEYTILLSSPPLRDLPKEREGWRYKVLKPGRLKTRIAIPLAVLLAKEKPDVIFSPTHYIPRFVKVKRVMMVFDLAYLHFPEMFLRGDLYKLQKWTKYSVDNAAAIITISRSSKNDLVKHLKVDPEKIIISYPGFNDEEFKEGLSEEKRRGILRKYGIEGSYIVFVGTLQPRKNLIRLIEAFKNINNLKLVVVGKTKGLGRQAWMFEDILARPKELGIEEKIIFTGYISDEELPYIVSGAVAYCLPSLWEGFGIPVIEAMACGVPAIVSNVSSLPEAVGKAGLLVDPKSVDQIEQAIRTVATDKKLRERLSRLGVKQSKKYSWKKMAKEVILVLEGV